jgi:pimeloyl-ACP methyl ester carboxylesterase
MTDSHTPRGHRWWAMSRSIVIAMCLLVMSAACAAVTGQAAASPAAGAPGPGIAWATCPAPHDRDPALQCATVSVPLDWNQPQGPHIGLAVARHLASRPQERIGSMLVNPGGPGQGGVGLVLGSGSDFDEWGGGRFDVVGWDPRGTNGSSPVDCFTSDADRDQFWQGVAIPSTEAESQAYQRKAVELARRCGQVNGELLNHISTADTARDLEALRVAVGDNQLTYVGLSYGSMIGQTYANLFPGRVRAMMLDGLVDAVQFTTSSEARTATDVASTDEGFAQFRSLCQSAGPARCALAGHPETVDQRVAGLFARAQRAPIPAPHADPPGELSYGDLLTTTFSPLRLPSSWPQYGADLDAAANGDASALETSAREMRSPEAFAGSTTSASISCLDGPAASPSTQWPREIGDFTGVSKIWGPVLGWWLWAPCASNWPGRSNDRYTGPWNARTTTPILLINNRYDPATGYRNAQVTEHRLGNAVLLTVNGWGHPSYQEPSTCTDQARVRYLVDLITPPPGTVCQPDRLPFP